MDFFRKGLIVYFRITFAAKLRSKLSDMTPFFTRLLFFTCCITALSAGSAQQISARMEVIPGLQHTDTVCVFIQHTQPGQLLLSAVSLSVAYNAGATFLPGGMRSALANAWGARYEGYADEAIPAAAGVLPFSRRVLYGISPETAVSFSIPGTNGSPVCILKLPFSTVNPAMAQFKLESGADNPLNAFADTGGVKLGWVIQGENPFALNYLSFEAHVEADIYARLQWAVSSLKAGTYFEIQKRRRTESEFRAVATLSGITAGESNFFFRDSDPLTSRTTYRIRYVEPDGTFGYSKLHELAPAFAPVSVKVYPNPFSTQIMVENSGRTALHRVQLFSHTGKLIAPGRYRATQTGETLILSTTGLPAGAYLLLATFQNGQQQAFNLLKL